jgi:hypothetical protein
VSKTVVEWITLFFFGWQECSSNVHSLTIFVSTILSLFSFFLVCFVPTVSIPALQALLANLAPPGESGALLGAVGSMTELTGAIGSTLYAVVLAAFATPLVSDDETSTETLSVLSKLRSVLPVEVPGMHFLVGASCCLIGWAISSPGLKKHRDHPALAMGFVNRSSLAAADV